MDLSGESRILKQKEILFTLKGNCGVVSQTTKVLGDRIEVIAKKISWLRRSKDCMLA